MPKQNYDPSHDLHLKDLIRAVHQEIIESSKAREQDGYHPLFYPESLSIEAHFIVTESKKGDAGFSLKILTLEGSKEIGAQKVHKITLNLKALQPDKMPSLQDPHFCYPKRIEINE